MELFLAYAFFFIFKNIPRESGFGGRMNRLSQCVICIKRSIPTTFYELPPHPKGSRNIRKSAKVVTLSLEGGLPPVTSF